MLVDRNLGGQILLFIFSKNKCARMFVTSFCYRLECTKLHTYHSAGNEMNSQELMGISPYLVGKLSKQ